VDAGSAQGQFVFAVMLMTGATLLTLVESVLMMSLAPLLWSLFGWAVVLLFGIMRGTLFNKVGASVGAITVPSGGSTPSVAQHSNIEALVARGQYAQAAEAYRAVIAAEPADLVACEKLGQLASQELKDYPLAIEAYREAERRHPEPKRRAGYALLVAGIYRDNLKDTGRTLVELRRILARYPDLPNAARLRAEIDELKAAHFEEP